MTIENKNKNSLATFAGPTRSLVDHVPRSGSQAMFAGHVRRPCSQIRYARWHVRKSHSHARRPRPRTKFIGHVHRSCSHTRYARSEVAFAGNVRGTGSHVLKPLSQVCRSHSDVSQCDVSTRIEGKDQKMDTMCSFPEIRYRGMRGVFSAPWLSWDVLNGYLFV